MNDDNLIKEENEEEAESEEEEFIDTNTIKTSRINKKKKYTEEDIDTPIETVSYEQNQKLLRAFGGQNVANPT